jgi:hypothetical protein
MFESRSIRRIGILGMTAALPMLLVACGGATQQVKAAETKPAEAKPAAAAPAGPLLTVADMVVGAANLSKEDAAAGKSCVETSLYLHNQQVVWRIKVVDPATGLGLDDKAVSKVEVALPDGQKFTAKYGAHPKGTPTDSFWATSWTIPENYPSGTVTYKVNVESKDGRQVQPVAFNVAVSQLIVADGKVPVIVAEKK